MILHVLNSLIFIFFSTQFYAKEHKKNDLNTHGYLKRKVNVVLDNLCKHNPILYISAAATV